MRVRAVDTMRSRDVTQFIRFPFDLYRDCRLWVPPLVSEVKMAMDRGKHPFYRHSGAEFFVAEDGTETLGRIAVLENRNYNKHQGCKAAFFYYFDSVDDTAVSRALFEAAIGWARQRGLEEMLGPKGLIGTSGIGLLVEGFEHRPAMGIPYNYAYYERLLLDARFEKRGDLVSGYLSGESEVPARVLALAEKVKTRRGLRVKTFSSRRELKKWVARGAQVLNEAFADTYDFYPISDAEFTLAAGQMLQLVDPRLIKLVMRDDEIVGFLFAFPDVSLALQKANGRLWPLGWLYIVREMRRTKWVNLNGLGMHPSLRGVGGNVLLYSEMAKTLKESGFDHADVVQVGEENSRSLAENEAFGVKWYKRHRVYCRPIETPIH